MSTPESPQMISASSPSNELDGFQIGVVGHRHDRLINADLGELKSILNIILKDIKNEFLSLHMSKGHLLKSCAPALIAISPLAEGADRLFAEQALDLEFELCCVMPFTQTEFENDFSPDNALEHDSLSRFHDLLKRAEKIAKLTRIELEGKRENEATAYGAAGDFIIHQSNVLIAVWDGEYKGLAGGTEETFKKALNKGVPVIWIDANAPHLWKILKPESSQKNLNLASLQGKSSSREQLHNLVRNILFSEEKHRHGTVFK